MQIVPPRVASILRALDGLPAQHASALLRQMLVGLDAVERASMRHLLPEQAPALAPFALTLLADPRELPTVMQREPMPWEPAIENAEIIELPVEPPPAAQAAAAPAAPDLDADVNAQLALMHMLRRSRLLTAGAAAALLLGIVVGALCVVLGSSAPTPVAAPPERALRQAVTPEPEDLLPPLPVARKRPVAAAKASSPTRSAHVDPDPRTSWAAWPKGANTRASKGAAVKQAADDDLTRAWNER